MKRILAVLIALAVLVTGCLPLVPPPPPGHGGHFHGEYREHHWDRH